MSLSVRLRLGGVVQDGDSAGAAADSRCLLAQRHPLIWSPSPTLCWELHSAFPLHLSPVSQMSTAIQT